MPGKQLLWCALLKVLQLPGTGFTCRQTVEDLEVYSAIKIIKLLTGNYWVKYTDKTNLLTCFKKKNQQLKSKKNWSQSNSLLT